MGNKTNRQKTNVVLGITSTWQGSGNELTPDTKKILFRVRYERFYQYFTHTPSMRTAPLAGFSLVELIVSVGLFALVMLVATSAYFNLISLDRQARATNQIVNNLSFAIDTIVRGVRTGTNFECSDNAALRDSDHNSTNGSCKTFSYTDTGLGATVTYEISSGRLYRCEGTSVCTPPTRSPLTDPSITLDSTSAFYVRGVGTGAAPTSDQQPQVLFVLKGSMPSGVGKTVPFLVQESATQRIIEL